MIKVDLFLKVGVVAKFAAGSHVAVQDQTGKLKGKSEVGLVCLTISDVN